MDHHSVKSIGDYAFIGSGLISVNIPDSVASIGDYAFFGSSVTSVNIPNSVKSIGKSAFVLCGNLMVINVTAGNTAYTAENGVLYNKDKTVLLLCPGGKAGSISIPNSVTGIGENAFNYCAKLTGVTIPNSVTSIEQGAFSGCTSLDSVTIPNSVKSIRDAAFWGCHSLVSVTFQGTIPSSGFSNDPRYISFPGDLCNKFYATDPVNGTPGTYTRPDGKSETWTKQ